MIKNSKSYLLTIVLVATFLFSILFVSAWNFDNGGSSITTYSANLSNFTQLQDTPSSYTGYSGKCLTAKATEDGLEFVNCSTSAGDITAVNAGTGLTGGGDTGSVTLNVNGTYVVETANATGYIINWNGSGWIIDWNQSGYIQNWSNVISPTGDNSSWNESYAFELFLNRTSEGLYLSTYNSTYDGYNSTGLIKDWNETGYIKDWNESGYIQNWNLTGYIRNWLNDIFSFNYWNDTYFGGIGNFSNENSTIARIGDCPDGQWVQNITTGGVECLTPPLSESDPLSLHLNQDNWNNDTDGYIYWENQDTITFNQSKLTTIYYNASTVESIAGTPSGTVTNIRQYNSDSYNVTEEVSNPGLDVRVNFTGVTAFNSLVIRYKSSTTESHQIDIQFYDYGTSSWEDYGTLATINVFETKVLGVFDGDSHVSGGLVQLRFLSPSTGNPSHDHYFDWVTISNGLGTPSGQEVDPYSYHKDENINATGYNVTADYFFGNGSQLTGLTLTETDPHWSGNQSNYYNKTDVDTNISDANTSMKNYVDGIVTTNNESWSTTYNSTYDGYNSTGLIKDWNDSGYIIDWNSTGYIKDWNGTGLIINWSDVISATGDNSSWNETYAKTIFANISFNYNQTTETINILNGTGLIKDWNESGYIINWNSTELIINWSDVISSTGDNSSWNETYADGKYILQSEEANLNVNSSSYWVGANDYNQTQFEILNLVFNIRESWLSGLFDTFFGAKTTDDLPQGSTNLYDNQTFNETWTDGKYALIGATDNSSWNESYANTIYYQLLTNPLNYWNSTFATFNKTYADTLYAPISEPLAYNGTLALNASLANYLEKDGDTGIGVYNFTSNVTIGSNVINEWNGTCYNTYVGGTLIQSIGCS